MAKIKLWLLGFVLGLWAPRAVADPLAWLPQLFDTLVAGYYSSADSICRQIEIDNPGHPVYLYARATVIYTGMVDFEDSLGLESFYEFTDSCVKSTAQRIRLGGRSDWVLHYLCGSANAARGLTLARNGQRLAGLRALMQAKEYFARCIELNPGFGDAYVGRGAYRYAVATNAGMFAGLPFIPSRKAGLEDLWRGVRDSQFSKYQALTALVWFCLDDKDYRLADSICHIGLERFPNARSFLWPLLALRKSQERWTEVEQVARLLLAQYLMLPRNTGYDTINLYLTLTEAADALKRPHDAAKYASEGLNTYATDQTKERRKLQIRQLKSRVDPRTK